MIWLQGFGQGSVQGLGFRMFWALDFRVFDEFRAWGFKASEAFGVLDFW